MSGTLVRRTENGKSQSLSDAIARRGHSENRVIHSSFKDLIPLRQREDVGLLARPSEEEVTSTKERTEAALNKLIGAASAAQKPKSSVQGTSRAAPTYVSYTPDSQMGQDNAGKTRLIKIVERQLDPMEPPKHKHKKIPRGPPSPPPPVMHSPPRKLTAEDQEMWRIPPPVSNWKNPKGFTVPLDKRLASDGRSMQDVTINDKFAQFSEALQTADRHAREEVKQRSLMQQRLAEKEKLQQEDRLRALAMQAREGRSTAATGNIRGGSASPRSSRSRSYDSYASRSPSPANEDDEVKVREKARRERREEAERQLRQSRMGTERRIQQMARDQNRDISEKVALGIAKPTQGSDSMYDSRLFNRSSGFNTGFNEDQAYDKPLFAAQNVISSIYRPSTTADEDAEDPEETMNQIRGTRRFEGLGGRGAAEDAKPREGPVQFEKDTADPFGINDMIADVKANGASGSGRGKESGGSKRYGIQESGSRGSKRARIDDDDD